MIPVSDDTRAGFWALTVGGWTVCTTSLYDEEGVEGWRWSSPYGVEVVEIGDWWDLPPVPDEVVAAWKARNE